MINIKRFVFNPLQENTYVIYGENKECAIVDPGCNSEQEKNLLVQFISENNLQVKYLINTHGHFDHVLGNSFVKEKYSVDLLAHKEDEFLLENLVPSAQFYSMKANASPKIDQYLNEGDRLFLGEDKIEIVHLPGHSPGSIGLYYSEKPFVIVGDVLFRESIGRTDLPKGDYDQLMHSIREKLFSYSSDTIVYPGHGPTTSIGIESKSNPFIM